jgi:hypothetical protein
MKEVIDEAFGILSEGEKDKILNDKKGCEMR